ncbi:MAG TPA: aspartyl-phosphate phosphatase Spo0E family protein [Thermoanaerobacterales bacterium]|jgi:predicted translin family RNA/ssDNA-binding protein|nr:aspartyl-phosphate phosphatase Spo0E family protein [Thermoanaerobacterales bacterium]
MNVKDKIETARNVLHYAINKDHNKEKILKISREVDKYIVEHYKKCHGQKDIISNSGNDIKEDTTQCSKQ